MMLTQSRSLGGWVMHRGSHQSNCWPSTAKKMGWRDRFAVTSVIIPPYKRCTNIPENGRISVWAGCQKSPHEPKNGCSHGACGNDRAKPP